MEISTMKNDSILFVGLDTHKTNTEVAYVIDGRENSPQHFGKILTNKQAFIKLARQLQSKHPNATLHFVYEAGPCGYYSSHP